MLRLAFLVIVQLIKIVRPCLLVFSVIPQSLPELLNLMVINTNTLLFSQAIDIALLLPASA